jgi:hypothetical protein
MFFKISRKTFKRHRIFKELAEKLLNVTKKINISRKTFKHPFFGISRKTFKCH